MGIDYGKRRVGVALTDDTATLAFPHKVIQNSVQLLDDIRNICKAENVSTVVLGQSLDLSGKENELMGDLNKFKDSLETGGLVVVWEPEYYTTQEAKRLQGKNSSTDASAAALILKSYLEKTPR